MKKHLIKALLFGMLQVFVVPYLFIDHSSSIDNNFCKFNLHSSSNKTNYLSTKENIALKAMQTSVILNPINPNQVSASEMAQLYTGDWDYAYAVKAYGYTATDDLWTILSYNHIDSELFFDKVQLTIHAFPPESDEIEKCIQDIIKRAESTSTTFKIYIE